MYQLVWDESDPNVPDTQKLIKANYDSLDSAKAQAKADIEVGRNIIGILDEDGNMIWTAKNHSHRKNSKVVHAGTPSYPWKFEDE